MPAIPAAVAFVFWLGVVTWRPLLRRLVHLVGAREMAWVLAVAGVLLVVLISPSSTPLPFDRGLLAAVLPALSLLPVVTWLAAVAWPRLCRSEHLALRAAADIVLSALAGAAVLLALLVAANLAGLSPRSVAAARALLERLAAVTDVPQAVWIGLYALLALVAVAMVVWPRAMASTERWWATIRLPLSVEVGRRGITVVHLALLVTTLVGVAAAPALEPTARGVVRARYTLALRDQLDVDGRLAAYRSIQRAAADPGTIPPAQRQAMAAMFTGVRDEARQQGGGAAREADIERDLAWRLGALQARSVTVRIPAAPGPLTSDAAEADLRRFDEPVADPADLRARVGALADRQEHGERGREALRRAAELAASALASAILLPGAPGGDRVQVVQEFLSGLVEGSPLNELLFQAAERLWFHEPPAAASPPEGEVLVVVEATRLRILAGGLETLARLEASLPAAESAARERAEREWATLPDAVAVVAIVNATRMLEQSPSCRFCVYHGEPGSPEARRAEEAHAPAAAGGGHGPIEPRPVERPFVR